MLFDYYEPSRLHRLTEGVNYMQWDARIRFQKLANPFLYERLIPAMKGRWW